MIGSVMLDIAGTTLTQDDRQILQHPQVGGVILFARNVISPEQVRTLTDEMRTVRRDLLIAVDQEGGRVQRLKPEHGFSALPAMGRLGALYLDSPSQAIQLAEQCGYLMASEVLAVGIDFSFAPVLDLNDISDVIGDRGFADEPSLVITLADAFMRGMKQAGMATTGKHFPGHGSVKADSHIAPAIDHRTLTQIERNDLSIFKALLPHLDALMPAHVIYPQVDAAPAGFSYFWLQEMIRTRLNFHGVLFSDDLSMEAAAVAGDAGDRLRAALHAGCDMGLVCNDRQAAITALQAAEQLPLPDQSRLSRMRGQIKSITFDQQGRFSPVSAQLWQPAQHAVQRWLDRCSAT